MDEITWELIEQYISGMMDKGNRVTAINARLRALFVFLRYCFDQEYLDEYTLTLIKEDETLKEPYTEAELQKELVLECGDIKLYPLRMEVEAGGSKVVLAPKEYFLLKTLMENKGIVLGRDRLLDLVWGLGFDGSDRVVDTHIKKLRKALGHSGEAVRTVIGGGYKIM